IESFLSPAFERDFSGNDCVPPLPKLEDPSVAPGKERLAIASANKNESKKQRVSNDRTDDSLQNKGRRPEPPELFTNGCHSSLQNSCPCGFACASGSLRTPSRLDAQ